MAHENKGPRWVKVTDRLPDGLDTVVVWLREGEWTMAQYQRRPARRRWWNIQTGQDLDTVTHWLEIQEPK